jgi:hypothetical protein
MQKSTQFRSAICQFKEKYKDVLTQVIKEHKLDERRINNLFTLIKMKQYFLENGYTSFQLRLATQEYYDNKLPWRSKFLGTLTPDHLCKTMVMENKKYKEENAG